MTGETQIGPRIDSSLYHDYKWFVTEYNDAYKGRLSKEVQKALRIHMGLVLTRDLSRIARLDDIEQRERLTGYVEDFLDRLAFMESEIDDRQGLREDLDAIKRGEFDSRSGTALDDETFDKLQDEYPSMSGGTTGALSREESLDLAEEHDLSLSSTTGKSTSNPDDTSPPDPNSGKDDLNEKIFQQLLTIEKRLEKVERQQNSQSNSGN